MSLPSRTSKLHAAPLSPPEWRVPLSAPSYSEEDILAVVTTMRTGWWTMGPETQRLEADFAEYLGVRHAIAVSSGTAALHLAMLTLDPRPGGEVILPSLTFVAAANAILHAGGTPRFSDVDSLEFPLVSAETLERSFTPRSRGICVMHYGGHPCAMDAIVEFANRHKLWIVEDAAHSPGAVWKGRRCGSWGDIGCFSFFGNKNITCAEGGLVVTQRDDLADRLRALRSHGMDSLTWERFQGHRFSYDVATPGFNYRMDDVRASLLRVQLKSIDKIIQGRRERVSWYNARLSGNPHWIIPLSEPTGQSVFHLFTVVLAEGVSRELLVSHLNKLGIQTSVHYPPVHQFTFYRKFFPSETDLSITEALGRRLLTLPLYPEMTKEQVDLVCDAILGAPTARQME